MTWKGRIAIELERMKDLNIKDNGIMYVSTEDIRVGYGLIKGDLETPYANGFYLIKFEIPDTYPFKPPECWHLSMSGVRQSPNFHDYSYEASADDTDSKSGKVCLSRLNTWEGSTPGKDKWTPSMTITGVLDMIRMQVLTSMPLDNEPDYRHSIENPPNAKNYEKFVRYHNFRSNIVNIYRKLRLHACNAPNDIQEQLAKVIHEYVISNIDWYKQALHELYLLDNGMYVTCSTYTNSSCLCDYEEVQKSFNNLFHV